jgi:hypothetical protein
LQRTQGSGTRNPIHITVPGGAAMEGTSGAKAGGFY